MKRIWTILVAGLLIAALTAPALAWEFTMTGEAEFRYRYFARTGDADLFGTAASTAVFPAYGGVIGFAGPAATYAAATGATAFGVVVQGFSAKGADAETNEARIWLYPEIRINEAIRLRGEYWVTGSNLRGFYDGVSPAAAGNVGVFPAANWTNSPGYNGWYQQTAWAPGGGSPAGMSVGVWEKAWITAQLPWGIFAVGRRPFPFGLGWSALHEKDLDTDTWLFAVPYGPFTFLAGNSWWESGDNYTINTTQTMAGVLTTPAGALAAPSGVAVAAGTDKNRTRVWNGAVAVVYRNGPVEFGTIPRWVTYSNTHPGISGLTVLAGPGQRDDFTNTAFSGLMAATHLNSPTTVINGDVGFVLWVSYFKYNNGRFFFNSEYDFEYGDIRRNGGRPISIWTDAWELEAGTLCGPTKIAVAGFYHSGHDRRGGLLNVTRATGYNGVNNVYDVFNQFIAFSATEEAIKPYAWLIGIYGAGNNSYDPRGKCSYNDFLAYAARVDYAVAANLNVWGSYIYMNRASNTGTGIGTFGGGAVAGIRTAAVAAPGGVTPNVPDTYLGWEANVGVDWKLLEGMTFKSQFGYWAPGDWFKWAYVDYTNNNLTPVAGGTFPVNPNRGIDPIIGFQGSVLVDF